eukprot:TRINITY_DN27290_c0_g1_i1.p1 TRINITY_DN27290_c0_g1~~TRINITY_DN27290_c0_g1_i1.p1  ORF type:complete len:145 (+),score=12.88 TRINITY_DN27290_c0_g1_i1:3-437(+)
MNHLYLFLSLLTSIQAQSQWHCRCHCIVWSDSFTLDSPFNCSQNKTSHADICAKYCDNYPFDSLGHCVMQSLYYMPTCDDQHGCVSVCPMKCDDFKNMNASCVFYPAFNCVTQPGYNTCLDGGDLCKYYFYPLIKSVVVHDNCP